LEENHQMPSYESSAGLFGHRVENQQKSFRPTAVEDEVMTHETKCAGGESLSDKQESATPNCGNCQIIGEIQSRSKLISDGIVGFLRRMIQGHPHDKGITGTPYNAEL
jgi:hypothetical protein